MSSTIMLSIKKGTNVEFDEFNAMNVELSAVDGVVELLDYDRVPAGSLFLQQTDDGFLWMNREYGRYATQANVYYCWDEAAMQVIANHMTSGVLVLKLAQYGDKTEYYRLEPGSVEMIEIE